MMMSVDNIHGAHGSLKIEVALCCLMSEKWQNDTVLFEFMITNIYPIKYKTKPT